MKENNNLLKMGIVGCGQHSHAHLDAAEQVPGIRFTSCCDISEDRLRECVEKYHCETYYTDLQTMLNNEKLDAVILCTWPMQHLEQIELCLSMGVKNILCEKALCLSGEEAVSIWKIAQKHDAFLMEGCKYRHHPAIHKLEQILSYRDIGKIDSIRATFSNYEPEDKLDTDIGLDWRFRRECGGGVPYDWMSYLVDACNHFSGGLPKRIFASGNESVKYGIINRIYGMIEYDNGIIGIIESSKEANFSQELQITCSNGILRLPIAWGIYREVKIAQTHRKQEWDYILTDTYEIEAASAFVNQLKNFTEVIRGREQPVIPLSQSVINAQTIDALVTSMMERRMITMERLHQISPDE